MLKEQVWRCFYEDGFVDVRRRTRPKSSPFPHKGELVRIEEVKETSSPKTIQNVWEHITKEVNLYAQEMNYEHKHYTTLDVKYGAVNELYQSWEYANRMDNPLLKIRCFYMQNWLHYGSDGGYHSYVPHVSIISLLIQKALHIQLRETKQEMLDHIYAIASFQPSEVNEIAAWMLSALDQAHPTYGRQHIVDVCIVQLMNALRREDQSRGDILVNGILTELWNALFVEEKR